MEFDPGRWQEVKNLFDTTLQQPPERRVPFLAAHCRDEILRREVCGLLENLDEAGSFLSRPPVELNPSARAIPARPTFEPGMVLAGRFRIVRFIARGGMGEVYEAEDQELTDLVAIKTIRPELLKRPSALDKFKREVSLAKQVTHPNVCRIYDLFRHSGPLGGAAEGPQQEFSFISMEFLPGETLAQRLRRAGRFTPEEAFPIVLQIARALEAAHAAKILHQDLKPANIILVRARDSADVRAVVTDFGLAFHEFDAPVQPGADLSVAGTFAYMSPEQLAHGKVTAASDIYALGLVMYEMLTGKHAFAETGSRSNYSATNETGPRDPLFLPPVDSGWKKVIDASLEPEPSRRLQSANAVIRTLSGDKESFSAPLRAKRRFAAAWMAARVSAFAFLGLWAATYIGFGPRDNPSAPRIENYHRRTDNGKRKFGPMVREGTRLYFMQENGANANLAYTFTDGADVIVPHLPTPEAFPVLEALNPQTGELLLCGDNACWLWAPGRSWAKKLGIKRFDHGAFSSDGKILAVYRSDSSAIELYNAETLAKLGPSFSLPPHFEERFSLLFSPTNEAIRFSGLNLLSRKGSLWELVPKDHSLRPLFALPTGGDDAASNACCGAWTPGGRWFVFSSVLDENVANRGDLWIIREQPGWRAWLNPPQPRPLKSAISFSWPVIGADGKTIFAMGSNRGLQAVRLDLQTREFQPFLNGAPAADLSPSNDRNWVAYTDDWNHTIWKSRSDGSERAELTFAPMEAYQPHWSPDGRHIAFMGRMPGGHWRAYVMPGSGGQPETVYDDNNEQGVPTWSANGRYLVFGDRRDQRPPSQMTIHVYDFRTHRLSELPGSAGRWSARWSPDGRYIAAQSADWHDICLFDIHTHKWVSLAAYHLTDDLNWSPDGAYLYFMATRQADQGQSIYRVRIADRKIEEILRHDEHPDLDPHLTGVAPDGSPVFSRVVSNEEIYALDMKWP